MAPKSSPMITSQRTTCGYCLASFLFELQGVAGQANVFMHPYSKGINPHTYGICNTLREPLQYNQSLPSASPPCLHLRSLEASPPPWLTAHQTGWPTGSNTLLSLWILQTLSNSCAIYTGYNTILCLCSIAVFNILYLCWIYQQVTLISDKVDTVQDNIRYTSLSHPDIWDYLPF